MEFVIYSEFNRTRTPVPGDLIEFHRGKYNHWAMQSDIPEYVFNIEAESKNNTVALITHRRLAEIAADSGIRINNMEGIAKLKGYIARSEIDAVAAARADLDNYVPYNFTDCNCEFYSTKWKYGQGFSEQVQNKWSTSQYIGWIGAGVAQEIDVPEAISPIGTMVEIIEEKVVDVGRYINELFTGWQ